MKIETTGKRGDVEVEEWYEIEISIKGADDWFVTTDNADTLGRIREIQAKNYGNPSEYETRIVKKTLTSEAVL